MLDNGRLAVKLPAEASGDPPSPITAVRLGDKWVGEGFWKTSARLRKFTARVIADGSVLAKLRLRYDFDGLAGIDKDIPAFAEVDVSLGPGWSHAELFERHEMARGDSWEFEASHGWAPRQGSAEPFGGGFGSPPPPKTRPLVPIVHTAFRDDMFINLWPRWNQGCKDGWFFAAHDDSSAVAALAVRPSRWLWPHDNGIEVIVKPSGDYAGLRAPTWKGQRLWWLLAGPRQTIEPKQDYIMRYSFECLDKLNHELISDWPGRQGVFSGGWSFGGINPTDGLCGEGRRAVADAGKAGNYTTLARCQSMMHPDMYGSYWNYWSPENPNFFTDFVRVPIALAAQLKAHLRFKEIARQAEIKFREDLYNSVTLPGGAGQECPGYLGHALEAWEAMAPMARKHLGFDPTAWDRFRAAQRFLRRISQPAGDERLWLHMGDTHPAYWKIDVPAAEVARSTTEELPGFAAGGRAANAVEQGSRLAYYPLPRHECTLIAREEGRCPMRAGAAIIVLIGVCIAGEVLFLRGTTADGGMMGFLLSSVGSDQELAELQNAVWRTIDFSIITNFTTLILLVALFIRVSRETNPKPRHYERPPKDAFVLLQRTTARRQFPFQFGIITLLAATLAVALICSAFSIPLQ